MNSVVTFLEKREEENVTFDEAMRRLALEFGVLDIEDVEEPEIMYINY